MVNHVSSNYSSPYLYLAYTVLSLAFLQQVPRTRRITNDEEEKNQTIRMMDYIGDYEEEEQEQNAMKRQ